MRTRKALMCMLAAVSVSVVYALERPDTLPSASTADAQHIEDLKNSQKVVFFGDADVSASTDSIKALMDKFYVDQYKHFQDPEAPYFLMMSRDATLAMGIGGAVRMRGWLDFDGSVPYNGFIPYTISVPENPMMRRRLDATPSGTALFFRIIGINKTFGNFSAFIQGSFDGGTGREFKIKKSYVTINDWTIGYTTSTFSDIEANPPVIDAQGPNGQVNNTSVLIQWRKPISKKFTLAASLEFPESHILSDGMYTAELKDWCPDIVAFGQYQWREGSGHVRLSALLRNIPYRNLVEKKNTSKIGFGTQISCIVPMDYNWTLFAEGVGGKGCETYLNDFMVGTLDLMPTPDKDGDMYAPWCYGLTCGIKYNFTSGLFASISGSEARLLPQKGNGAPDLYRYGLYGVANIIWNMSPRLQVGAEYLMGMRKNADGASGHAKRVNMLFSFSF